MLILLGGAPAWRDDAAAEPRSLPNTLPGWLIAFLALQADWVARERLSSLLWPAATTAEAQHNLRANLHRLRAVLAGWGQAQALQAERRRIRLQLPTDVAQLRARAAARHELPPQPPAPLLDSMGFDGFAALQEWVALERAGMARLWRDAQLARLERADPRAPATLVQAQRLVDADPLDEAALAPLLRALHAQGRGAEALRRYEDHRERLQRELGLEPAPALRALATAAPAPVAESGSLRDFVGRRLELADLARRLDGGQRLVTLVGPGGIGKSRLARQALANSPRAGAWVDLQDLRQIDSAATRIAGRLGTELREAADAAAAIARAIGDRPWLLVLDNAEHLDGLGALAAALRDAASSLAVLVTSRRPLGVAGESLLALDGLALPDEHSRDAEAAQAFDAVRLFVQRAQAARPGFSLAEHLDAVLAIVDAVGGLPLALELAASWVRLLPPQAIADDLRGTLAVLQRDPAAAGAPARPEHASLQAVLDRSWQLLDAGERQALQALSVFEGGFTHSAAAAVAGIGLPVLAALGGKGLLRVDDEGRFDLHPLVAADAARRLAADPERAAALRDRHAAHWAQTLAQRLAQSADDPRVIVAAGNADYANARSAWLHAVATRQHAAIEQLAGVWRVFFDTQGRYGEGAALLQGALQLPLDSPAAGHAVATVRGVLSMLLFRRQNLEQAIAVAEAGIALAEQTGARRALVACLLNAGSAHSILGQWRRSQPLFERALAIAQQDHERPEIAVALLNVGICAKKDGRADEALACYGRALALERELGRHAAAVRCLNNIGVIHMERNEWERTREHMAEGLRLCQQYGLASLAPYLETGLGQALYELGRFDDAERHLRHVQATVPAAELPLVHMNVTINLGRVALRRHRLDEARPWFMAAARLALASETEADQLDFAMYWAEWLRDSGRPDDAARTWLAVVAHPRTEAGVRQGCEEGLATLGLDAAARAAHAAQAPTLDALRAAWAALDEGR
ncbi:MAG: tetratricopeptide repeat protein [Rubrivivax sp.]|nr:tetratricopeptide repeat protein [Rubrivivax sp.]